MAPNSQHKEDIDNNESHVYHQVELKKLPSFSKLQTQVMEIVNTSSWWSLYGNDWSRAAVAVAAIPVGLMCLAGHGLLSQVIGIFLLGCYHGTLANKCGHLFVHGSMASSATVNRVCARICVDFIGGFSTKVASGIHVKIHHPHTNIIGLGDSSTWKAPAVPRYPYLFLLPLTLPVLTPLVSLMQIIESRDWRELATFSLLGGSGMALHCWMMVHFAQCSIAGSIVYLILYRAVLGIPYIHINIFQHIGMTMFSPKDRPVRIYQMASGCLNLTSSLFLDATFGHSLVSCHVEHHLFPRLSDNMCLKVKPLVRRYLLENNLPYHEDDYLNRLAVFIRDYKTLMVNAPPITHFVGIQ